MLKFFKMITSLPILTFHSIDEHASVISFPPGLFRRGLTILHSRGYRSLSLIKAGEILNNGEHFPDKSFVITFDDGYKSVYEEAFPVLKSCDMTATIFITTGERTLGKFGERLPSLQGRPMLSWGEIKEMGHEGIDFGAHTLTHPDLTDLNFERVKAEIHNSKSVLEDAINTAVSCFAHPYGRTTPQIQEFIKQHFTLACSTKLGFLNKRSDLYALERIDTYYLRTEKLFDLMVSRFFPLYIRLRSIPRQLRRTFWRGDR